MPTPPELTERERAILDLELEWFRFQGSKHQVIRDRFGISVTRYYQLLNALIDTTAAAVAEPVLVHRLQDRRDQQQRIRTLRRLAA